MSGGLELEGSIAGRGFLLVAADTMRLSRLLDWDWRQDRQPTAKLPSEHLPPLTDHMTSALGCCINVQRIPYTYLGI
jgi:hypothetical protein